MSAPDPLHLHHSAENKSEVKYALDIRHWNTTTWAANCKKDKVKSVCSYLNGSEVLVKLWIQWGKLINGAVESAVVVTQDLAKEERGKRDIHNNALNRQKWQWNTEAQPNILFEMYSKILQTWYILDMTRTSYTAFPSIFPTNSNSCKWFSWM